jgi:hypothetical protein
MSAVICRRNSVCGCAIFSSGVVSIAKDWQQEEATMRAMLLFGLACAVTGLAVSSSTAQPPPVVAVPAPPAVDSPAYRQFLNSDSTYKTYSRLTPSRGFTRVTPFGVESHYVEPGYMKQINSQFGFESREYVPGYGGRWQTPWQAGGYQAPGYYRYYYGPPLPPRQP